MNITTVPHLLAIASGGDCVGDLRCFYCGAPCDGSNPAKKYVRDGFTAYTTVADPGSTGVCDGCVLALREAAKITMVDGEVRDSKVSTMRGYSWIITPHEAVAASKAHMDRLRAVCLGPPEPPFAIILTDSGQTHQIYRGRVCWDRENVTLSLEGERINYQPVQLVEALALCGKLAACVGKPNLKTARWPATLAARIFDRYRDADGLVDEWGRFFGSPLCRLASWLTPKMEDCRSEHPSDFD